MQTSPISWDYPFKIYPQVQIRNNLICVWICTRILPKTTSEEIQINSCNKFRIRILHPAPNNFFLGKLSIFYFKRGVESLVNFYSLSTYKTYMYCTSNIMLNCFTSDDVSTFSTVFFFLIRRYMITIDEEWETRKADDGTILVYVLLSRNLISFFSIIFIFIF